MAAAARAAATATHALEEPQPVGPLRLEQAGRPLGVGDGVDGEAGLPARVGWRGSNCAGNPPQVGVHGCWSGRLLQAS